MKKRYDFKAEDFNNSYSDGRECPVAQVLKRNGIEDIYVSAYGVLYSDTKHMRVGVAKNPFLNGRLTTTPDEIGFCWTDYKEIVDAIQKGEFQSASIEIEIKIF